MKTNKFFKIALIIALVVLVGGMAMLGFLGFNNTVDYGTSYEINVASEEKLVNSDEIMKKVCDSYFVKKGLSPVGYSFSELDSGKTLIYRFKDCDDFKDFAKVASIESELKAEIDSAFVSETSSVNALTAKVSVLESKDGSFVSFGSIPAWKIVVSVAIAVVAIFLFLLIMEKFSAALTTVINSLLSGLLAVALVALVRLPAEPYIGVTCALAGILSAVITVVITERCKEIMKNVGNDKLSYSEVADTAVKESTQRICFVSALCLIASVALVAICPTYVRLAGIHFLLASAIGVVVPFAFTSFFWVAFNGKKKDRKAFAETDEGSSK